jgi:hypothetical protein
VVTLPVALSHLVIPSEVEESLDTNLTQFSPIPITDEFPRRRSGCSCGRVSDSGHTHYKARMVLWIVRCDLRRQSAHFNLVAHLLELRGLLFELRDESLQTFLLLNDC